MIRNKMAAIAHQQRRRQRNGTAKQRTAEAESNRGGYIGETKNQLRHGYGVYNYENKFFRYEGQWESGLKHGHGKLLLGDGGHYEGTFVKGEMEGHGYRVFGLSGNIYTGQFRRGEPYGQGLMRSPDGEQFEGDFREGRREGFGTLTERDGACYEGEFHGNRRHGEGFQVYANGDQYKGDWVKGQRHGHGVLRCSNGTTYEGQWRGGVYHGEGTMSHCSGVSYSGLWANGRPTGESVCLRLAGEGGREVVVVQGERFNIHFHCLDSNGSIATLESGRSFRVSAAIQSKAGVTGKASPQQQRDTETGDFTKPPFGYEATPYELLQLPQSTDSSQRSSTTTPPDSGSTPPPQSAQPLQLSRLTRHLYPLHSSSTHSLSLLSRDSENDTPRRSSLEPTTSTKSLQDLSSFADDDSALDSYTTPSISVTNGGEGSFPELFLPPPIIPLPQIKSKKLPRSSSRSLKSRENQSQTPPPSEQGAQSGGGVQTLQSQSRESIVGTVRSPSSLLVGESSVSIREREGDDEKKGVSPQSKAAKKLIQKRAKFCTPGSYVLTVTEVTSPPFLGKLLSPLHTQVTVLSQKTKKNRDSPLSNLTRSKSKPSDRLH